MKGLAVLISVLFMCSIAVIANAQDNPLDEVELSLACPSSVNAGSALNVDVTFYNWNCSSVTVGRVMRGLVANANNSLGGAGIYGPFPTAFSITVPAASCPYGYPESPGVAGPYRFKIIDVPTGLSGGRMGMAVMNIIDWKGNSYSAGACTVQIN